MNKKFHQQPHCLHHCSLVGIKPKGRVRDTNVYLRSYALQNISDLESGRHRSLLSNPRKQINVHEGVSVGPVLLILND
jgi:hypothetical protein